MYSQVGHSIVKDSHCLVCGIKGVVLLKSEYQYCCLIVKSKLVSFHECQVWILNIRYEGLCSASQGLQNYAPY